MSKNDMYVLNGYANRQEYLESLAEEMGIPLFKVIGLADMLGPSEDFDGLVTELEDLEEMEDGEDEEEW